MEPRTIRRLWLVRHAEAQLETEAGDDHARTLTRRGTNEASRAARRCADLGWVPDLVLASSAARARQTADILARELGLAARKVQVVDSLYLADPAEIRSAIEGIGPRITQLMVVAHNPGVSAFAQQCAPRAGLGLFDTAAVVMIESDAEDWSQLSAATVRGARYERAR